jgi:hypothetical protein
VRENTDTIQKNTESISEASEDGQKVNPVKLLCRTSRYQKAGQYHNLKITNMSFEDVAKLKKFENMNVSKLRAQRD